VGDFPSISIAEVAQTRNRLRVRGLASVHGAPGSRLQEHCWWSNLFAAAAGIPDTIQHFHRWHLFHRKSIEISPDAAAALVSRVVTA
jgi:hypothetical protein